MLALDFQALPDNRGHLPLINETTKDEIELLLDSEGLDLKANATGLRLAFKDLLRFAANTEGTTYPQRIRAHLNDVGPTGFMAKVNLLAVAVTFLIGFGHHVNVNLMRGFPRCNFPPGCPDDLVSVSIGGSFNVTGTHCTPLVDGEPQVVYYQ